MSDARFAPVHCSQCSTVLSTGNMFCGHCGLGFDSPVPSVPWEPIMDDIQIEHGPKSPAPAASSPAPYVPPAPRTPPPPYVPAQPINATPPTSRPRDVEKVDKQNTAAAYGIGMIYLVGCLVVGMLLWWVISHVINAGKLSGTYAAGYGVSSVTFDASGNYRLQVFGGAPPSQGTYKVKGDTLTLDPTSGQAAASGEANDPLYQAISSSLSTTLSSDHRSFDLGGITYTKQ